MFTPNHSLHDMTRYINFSPLFALIFVNIVVNNVRGEAIIDHNKDICSVLCERLPSSFFNDMTQYTKSCCQRGCRFYNLVDLDHSSKNKDATNSTKEACESSCKEAYVTSAEGRSACVAGCNLTAKQRVYDLVSMLSIALTIQHDIMPHRLLVMSLDMPDNDIMTDPGLKKELLPGWWDSEGFKLPQTFIQSVPRESGTVDYNISPDYSGESVEQSVSIPGSDWLQCASKNTGIPRWILGCSIVVGTAVALWLCFIGDKTVESSSSSITSIPDDHSNYSSNIMLVCPDDKPPKYTEYVNIKNKIIV